MSRAVFAALQKHLPLATGCGLAFRPLALCDTGPLFDATRDERFNQFLLWPRPDTVREMADRVRRYIAASDAGEMATLSVVDATTGRWLSLLRCERARADDEQGEFGVWTHPQMWKNGVSGRILSMAVDVGFTSSPAREFFCEAAIVNAGSIGMMRKAGMTPRREDTSLRPGEGEIVFDAATYSIKRETWLGSARAGVPLDWDDLVWEEVDARPASAQQIASQTLERLRAESAAAAIVLPPPSDEPMGMAEMLRHADLLGAAAVSAAVAVAAALPRSDVSSAGA